MSYIYELDPKYLGTLLASDRMEVANGALNVGAGTTQIPPDTHNRTILIGIGGTGIKTLNHIKRQISQRLQPQWDKYIAFLAIDSDPSELEKAPYLTPAEFVNTTRAGIQNATDNGKQFYPRAWLPFVDETEAKALPGLTSHGAGQRRLIGKMKIHYAPAAGNGVDYDIVQKLKAVKNQLAPLMGDEMFEVYVICGLCGGTGSGSFTEMPALIHEALNDREKTHIKTMLYMPDTVTAAAPPQEVPYLKANGYASLKELNYYQGMFMREGQKEVFPYNDPSTPTLELDHTTGFFYLPFLIGTSDGEKKDSLKIARETIAEFFVSILGKMTTASGGEDVFLVNSFESNVMPKIGIKPINPAYAGGETEAVGSLHEFPKRYGTIGFAKAAAPESIIRAYTVGKACQKAGLTPISTEARAAKAAAGEKFLPFLGEKQYSSVAVVNQKRTEMLAALTKFMASYQNGNFDYATVMPGGAPTWEAIHDGSADDASVRARVNGFITKAADGNATNAMETAVRNQFQTFRNAVKIYVQENGPMAFYNLYYGNAAAEGGKTATGIQDVLKAMVDDVNPQTGKPNVHDDPKAKLKEKNDKGNEIRQQKDGLLEKVWEMLYGKKAVHAGEWEKLYNIAVNAEIKAKRREFMLGKTGILKKCFLEPADQLARQLYSFGKILETMSEGYMTNGKKLDDYKEFCTVTEGATEVNIASLNTYAHAYLQKEASDIAERVDRERVRKALVDSFFADPESWLEVDENLLRRTSDSVSLKSDEVPIAARKMFDQCLKDTITVDMDVTISALFNNIKTNVRYEDYARDIILNLYAQSKPLFDFAPQYRPGKGDTFGYILYPRSLATNSPEIAAALESEAKQLFGEQIGFYASDFADGIMMYQMIAPFEIYHLRELGNWERQYETLRKNRGNGLHGLSPDSKMEVDKNGIINYTEQTSWQDYPAITYHANPQQKDADGTKCREGHVRDRLDAEIIDKAIEMGLLYCEEDGHGKYQINSIRLDKSVDWKFNLDLMDTDEIGLYPTGAELLREVVSMNRKHIEDLTAPVELAFAGQATVKHGSEESAWFYARKVLYMNRQRLYQIRDTMELVQGWNAAAEKENEVVLKKLKPGKMLKMIMAHLYYPNEDSIWELESEDGRTQRITSTAPRALARLAMADPDMSAIVDQGLILYYVYTQALEMGVDMDAGNAYAKKVLKAYADEELLDESTAKAQAMMKEERAIMEKLGADLGNPEQKLSRSFVNKMKELGIPEKNLIELIKFYSYLKWWNRV